MLQPFEDTYNGFSTDSVLFPIITDKSGTSVNCFDCMHCEKLFGKYLFNASRSPLYRILVKNRFNKLSITLQIRRLFSYNSESE